jgi:signal transduction histidine kinase
MPEPESLVLQLLRDMRADMATKDGVAELRTGMHQIRDDLRSEMHSLRADVASDLMTTRKELSEQIVGLRRAVVEYHSAVIGHGVIISELEARVRRLEQRIGVDGGD